MIDTYDLYNFNETCKLHTFGYQKEINGNSKNIYH